jgi:hypothetical protein
MHGTAPHSLSTEFGMGVLGALPTDRFSIGDNRATEVRDALGDTGAGLLVQGSGRSRELGCCAVAWGASGSG